MKQVVLASSSVFRRALMDRLQVPYEAVSPDIDETKRDDETPENYVLRLAKEKAAKIVQSYPDALVIGADMVAICQGKIYGKPGDYDTAVAHLEALSGQIVSFPSAVAVFDAGECVCNTIVDTKVTYRKLTRAQIDAYLKADEPYACAGAFKNESLGITLVESIQSDDPTALTGLPLILISRYVCRVD